MKDVNDNVVNEVVKKDHYKNNSSNIYYNDADDDHLHGQRCEGVSKVPLYEQLLM